MAAILDAIEHTKRGRLQEAESIYLKLLAAQPNDSDALHYLGVLRMGQRRRDEAIELVTKALKLAPRNAHAWNSLGNMVASTGKHAAAEFAYKSALELQPDFFEARTTSASCSGACASAKKRCRASSRVAELNPRLAVAHENIAMMTVPTAARRGGDRGLQALVTKPTRTIRSRVTWSPPTPSRRPNAPTMPSWRSSSTACRATSMPFTGAKLGYAAPQLLYRALAEFIAIR